MQRSFLVETGKFTPIFILKSKNYENCNAVTNGDCSAELQPLLSSAQNVKSKTKSNQRLKTNPNANGNNYCKLTLQERHKSRRLKIWDE